MTMAIAVLYSSWTNFTVQQLVLPLTHNMPFLLSLWFNIIPLELNIEMLFFFIYYDKNKLIELLSVHSLLLPKTLVFSGRYSGEDSLGL